jgi:hypothetical protein
MKIYICARAYALEFSISTLINLVVSFYHISAVPQLTKVTWGLVC